MAEAWARGFDLFAAAAPEVAQVAPKTMQAGCDPGDERVRSLGQVSTLASTSLPLLPPLLRRSGLHDLALSGCRPVQLLG